MWFGQLPLRIQISSSYEVISCAPRSVMQFYCPCTKRTIICCKMTTNFHSNLLDSFLRNWKKSKNSCFWAKFGLIIASLLASQSYDFEATAHAGAPLGVE